MLRRINLFQFIKIYIQRTKKYIQEYVFIFLINLYNNNPFINPTKSYSFFFQTLWRHLKLNQYTKNEVSILLAKNIPKYFKFDFKKAFIPYIESNVEKVLINTQLFKNDTDNLIKYLFNMINIEKRINLNINKTYIINHLNNYKLKDHNIFYITRYMDCLYRDLINNNIINNEEYIEEYYNQTKEFQNIIQDRNVYEFGDDSLNSDDSFEQKESNNHIKTFNCKFINDLNFKNN